MGPRLGRLYILARQTDVDAVEADKEIFRAMEGLPDLDKGILGPHAPGKLLVRRSVALYHSLGVYNWQLRAERQEFPCTMQAGLHNRLGS